MSRWKALHRRFPVFCWLCAVLAAQPLAAQSVGSVGGHESDAFLNQQRRIEEQIEQELESALPAAQRTAIDYGGWYSFHLFLFDDGINSSRTYRRNDLRVWSRITLEQGAHEFFVRGRLSFLDFNTGDSFDGRDNDWEGMNLERGYYQFDLRNALSAYAGRKVNYNVQMKVGRDLASLGTGFALSTPLDHVLLRAEAYNVRLTGLVGRTVGSAEDFDRSRSTTRTRRGILRGGSEVSWF